jgi:hypothetical protein
MNKALLALLTLLLGGQFFLRAHQPLALAGYADESHHIRRAEVAWEFTTNPLASYQPGKLLLYYYLGLFEVDRHDYLLVSRLAVALLSLLSGAATYAVGRYLGGYRAGLLALWLYLSAPFAFFFDRMALADPPTLTMLLLTTWAALHWSRRPTARWSALLALLMILTPLAKLTAIAVVAIPPLAIWWAGKVSAWRAYLRPLMAIYMTFILIWIPLFTPAILGELRGGENRVVLVGDYLLNIHEPEQNFIQNLADNLWEVIYQTAFYSSGVGLGVIVLAWSWLLWRKRQTALLLAGLLILAWLPTLVLGSYPSTRYLQIGIPFIILAVAIGLDSLVQARGDSALARTAVYSAMGVYTALWCGTFWVQSITRPQELSLPPDDLWRYVQSGTAGYGQREAVAFLEAEAQTTQQAIPVYGILGSCHLMRLYLPDPSPVHLTCAQLQPGRQLAPFTLQAIRQSAQQHGALYLLRERELNSNWQDLGLHWDLVRYFPRPRGGVRLELWRVRLGDSCQTLTRPCDSATSP